ncbi:hypothetical protein D5086_011517 [Populus alba]|uniref:Uncharacterized protein n=1 Tax=Populus alba TaxID=43335 RepID=A0ACC4CCM0_POPAL
MVQIFSRIECYSVESTTGYGKAIRSMRRNDAPLAHLYALMCEVMRSPLMLSAGNRPGGWVFIWFSKCLTSRVEEPIILGGRVDLATCEGKANPCAQTPMPTLSKFGELPHFQGDLRSGGPSFNGYLGFDQRYNGSWTP